MPFMLKPTSTLAAQTSTKSLRLRLATLHDVKQITTRVVPIVRDDGFHDYFFPKRNEYPKDFFNWWYRYWRDLVLRPYLLTFVAERVTSPDDKKGEMVGVVIWGYEPLSGHRLESGSPDESVPKPKGLKIGKDTCFEILRRKFFACHDKIYDKYHPNRCLDPTALAEFRKVMADLEQKLWMGKDRVHWYTAELIDFTSGASLGLNPFLGTEERKLQGSDVFSLCLQWAMNQSLEVDKIPVFILCTPQETDDFLNVGFEQVREVVIGPKKAICLRHAVPKE